MELSERTFGVEIECGHETYSLNANKLQPVMQAAGFNCQSDYDNGGRLGRAVGGGYQASDEKNWYKKISIGHDGSGLEVRTPILKGQKGMDEFGRLMDWLREQGCYANHRDGMHVHHGCPELVANIKLIGELAEAWYDNREFIHSFVPQRRKESYACTIMSKQTVDRIKVAGVGPRGELNLAPVRNGHIEIRLHEGTLDTLKASAWVLFGQRFIDRVVVDGRPPKGYALNADNFLKNLGIEKVYREALIGGSR